MTRIDAVRQLQFLRQDALSKAHPQSLLVEVCLQGGDCDESTCRM